MCGVYLFGKILCILLVKPPQKRFFKDLCLRKGNILQFLGVERKLEKNVL